MSDKTEDALRDEVNRVQREEGPRGESIEEYRERTRDRNESLKQRGKANWPDTDTGEKASNEGISREDYFAGKALQSFLGWLGTTSTSSGEPGVATLNKLPEHERRETLRDMCAEAADVGRMMVEAIDGNLHKPTKRK